MRRTQQIAFPAVTALLLIAVIVFGFLKYTHHAAKSAKIRADLSGQCAGQSFASGSTGTCVTDIQTLVNYMEHSGLTECPFTGGALLDVNGTYDTATTTQIRSVQEWSNCYAKQEGFTSNVKITGTVDKATWGELCTYGYTDPLHTSATSATNTIATGKDAGCAEL
jgi:hypothetical protein